MPRAVWWLSLVLLVSSCVRASSYDARCHEVYGGVCVPHEECRGEVLASCGRPPGALCCGRTDVATGFRAAQQWLYAAEVADRAAEPVATLWLFPADAGPAGVHWALWPQPAAAGFAYMTAAVLRSEGPPAVHAPSQRVLPPGMHPHSARDTRLPLLLNFSALGVPDAALSCGDAAASVDLAVYAGVGTDDRPGYAAGEHWATCADPALFDVPPDCTNATLFARLLRGVQRYEQRCHLDDDCPARCAPDPAPDASIGLCMPATQCAAVGGREDTRVADPPRPCGAPEHCAGAVCCLPDTPGVRAALSQPSPTPSSPATSPAAVTPSPVPPHPSVATPVEQAVVHASSTSTARAILLWLLLAALLLCVGCGGTCAYRCVRRARMRAVRDAPIEMSALADFDESEADDPDWRTTREQAALMQLNSSSSDGDPAQPPPPDRRHDRRHDRFPETDDEASDDAWTELATLMPMPPLAGGHRASARV